MKTKSEMKGQIELGAVEHEGKTFVAGGSSTIGRDVTGYLETNKRGEAILRRWSGALMLRARVAWSERYFHDWLDPEALVCILPRGRWLVGYSIGAGQLFRGEILDAGEVDGEHGAIQYAKDRAQWFAELDAEDEARAQEELDEEPESDD